MTWAVLLVLCLGLATAPAATLVSDTTWRPSDGPVMLGESVVVARGATLTVEPGVTVRAAPDAALIVYGQLQACGTAELPITFTRRDVRHVPSRRLNGTRNSRDLSHRRMGSRPGAIKWTEPRALDRIVSPAAAC